MPSLLVPNPLSVAYVEPEVHVPEFKATPISWYTTRFSNRKDDSQEGYCGQDESALLYLHLPRGSKVNLNLNRTHPEDDFKLETYADGRDLVELLSWIENMSHSHEKSFRDAEFVCQRFDLVDMMLMPYSKAFMYCKSFKMHVAKVQGKIYIKRVSCEVDVAEINECLQSAVITKRSKQGLILQHYLMSGSSDEAPVASKPYIRGEKSTFVVFQGEIGNHQILYNSKVKALDKREDLLDLGSASFTDVKTNNGMSPFNINWIKWLNFWANHITGKKSKVAVGFVSNVHTGVVKNLEIIKGASTMLNCQQAFGRDRKFSASRHSPNGAVCLDTLEKVLTFLKKELENADSSEVFELEFNSADQGSMKANLHKIEPRLVKRGVLPNWYKSWLSA